MFNTRSLPPTTQKSADSSTFWHFFYYRPPGKFRWRSLKSSCQEFDIYRYYRYKQFDNRYGFSISIGNTNVNMIDLTSLMIPGKSTLVQVMARCHFITSVSVESQLSVDPGLCRHMASLAHSELKIKATYPRGQWVKLGHPLSIGVLRNHSSSQTDVLVKFLMLVASAGKDILLKKT